MINIEQTHSAIFERFNDLSHEQSFLYNKKNRLIEERDAGISNLYQKLNIEKSQFNEKIRRLTALIDIAKNHCYDVPQADGMEEYDIGMLSRLNVQIDTRSYNDSFAKELCLHAGRQLNFLRNELEQIEKSATSQEDTLRRKYSNELSEVQYGLDEVAESIKAFINSDVFSQMVDIISQDVHYFSLSDDYSEKYDISTSQIGLGLFHLPFSVPDGADTELIHRLGYCYDSAHKTIGLPLKMDISDNYGLFIEFDNENEEYLLSAIRNIIINLFRHAQYSYKQIYLLDPIRYNNSALGCLQDIAQSDTSCLKPVPHTENDIKTILSSTIKSITSLIDSGLSGNDKPGDRRLFIFHDFPHSYDSQTNRLIQQLVMNMDYYNADIIITSNILKKNSPSYDDIATIRSRMNVISASGIGFKININNISGSIKWYTSPETLPVEFKQKYGKVSNKTNLDNDYDNRVGIEGISYRKGRRRLEDIPYGVDGNGNLLTIDFENSNFATFICGASRSGKSTLLHTLVTGLIKYNHPDDIELWLIDFKMTEFSRYVTHTPPHVRYILLDESPEMVYDIVDRLSEILAKRQSIFKGKWEKLSDVPDTKYMPSILVIIDEFSVMSQIIADSVLNSKENYVVKMQMLLAKGAALGMHFIFASQGFTSGTRGLNDFSKNQIQQRIAMKTDYNEIKATLDLKNLNDGDRYQIEQLPVHYTLTRVPADETGNRLIMSHVMYLSDPQKQEKLIDNINSNYTKASKYDVTNTHEYIYKKTLIVDGNNYSSYQSKKLLMDEYIENERLVLEDGSALLFIGEPRRMIPVFPIEITKSYCENMLIIGPITEKMPMTSVIMSAVRSLEIFGSNISVWSTGKNEIYKQILRSGQPITEQNYKEIDEVCIQIDRIKNNIQNKVDGNEYIIILGTETLMMDMSYQKVRKDSIGTDNKKNIFLEPVSKRAEGEPDLLTKLSMMKEKRIPTTSNMATPRPTLEESEDMPLIYDAREDLKYILKHGPRMGYHFIVIFNSTGELKQNKVDPGSFKHKVMFRQSRTDAAEVVGSFESKVVNELENHSFRYTDGINPVSFRPLLHPGLSWDGWRIDDNNNVVTDTEEEYLL